MNNQLKLQVQATIDQNKSNKEIKAQLKAIQDGVKLKIGIQVDDKTTKQGLKSYEQMQNALGKTIINQRKEIEAQEKKQALAVNKYLDQEYAKRLKNLEVEKQIKLQQFNLTKQTNQGNWDNRFKDSVSSLTAQNTELKKMASYYRSLEKETAKVAKAQEQWNTVGVHKKTKLAADFRSFLNENVKIDQTTDRVKNLRKAIDGIGDTDSLRRVTAETNSFKSEMKSADKVGRTFASEMANNLKKVVQWLSLTTLVFTAGRTIKNMIESVTELDHALTNLKKVTEETDAVYSRFLDNAASSAKRLGTTMIDIVESTSEFAKLGFSIQDALALAETSSVYSMVGDMGIDQATQSIVSTISAFGISADNAMDVVDKFNAIGNQYAISSEGIGESLRRSAASLKESGNTIDEAVALVTAANKIIQDPAAVGTALTFRALVA